MCQNFVSWITREQKDGIDLSRLLEMLHQFFTHVDVDFCRYTIQCCRVLIRRAVYDLHIVVRLQNFLVHAVSNECFHIGLIDSDAHAAPFMLSLLHSDVGGTDSIFS